MNDDILNSLAMTQYAPPSHFNLPKITLTAYRGELIGLDWFTQKSEKLLGKNANDFMIKSYHQLSKNQLSENILLTAIAQLSEYFNGNRQNFDLPLNLNPFGNNATDFQIQTWQALCDISYGQTISYATLASNIGKPTAFRAVANANGKNPISLIVPCHRVIASNGAIGGYTGGVGIKQVLLAIESQNLAKFTQ